MKILKKIVLAASALFMLMAFTPPLASALDCTKAPDKNTTACVIQGGVNTAAGGADQNGAGTSIHTILASVLNVFSLVIGVIAVIVIMIAGLNYITSGGDAGKAASAKSSILYAVIGLIVVAFAQLIVHFAINASQRDVTKPSPGEICSDPVTADNPDGDPNCKCSSQGCVEVSLYDRRDLRISKLSTSLTG